VSSRRLIDKQFVDSDIVCIFGRKEKKEINSFISLLNTTLQMVPNCFANKSKKNVVNDSTDNNDDDEEEEEEEEDDRELEVEEETDIVGPLSRPGGGNALLSGATFVRAAPSPLPTGSNHPMIGTARPGQSPQSSPQHHQPANMLGGSSAVLSINLSHYDIWLFEYCA